MAKSGPWRYLLTYRLHFGVGALLLVATNACALAIPWALGRIVDALRTADVGTVVPRLAMLMIALAAIQAVTRIASRIAIFNAARRAEYDLRGDLFEHLLTLDAGYFRSQATGDLMSRLINDVQSVRAMWGFGILNVVNTAFVFTAALALMFSIDPWLTLWAILPYPSMVILGRFFAKKLYVSSRAVQETLGHLSTSVQEDLAGIGVIKTYNLEANRRQHFQRMSHELLSRNMELVNIRGQLIPALTGLASASTIIVLWVGGMAVINDELELGRLVQMNAYLALLVWPTLALGWLMSSIQRGIAAWRRLEELLSSTTEIVDGAGPSCPPDQVAASIRIRGLTYSVDSRKILNDINLYIAAGSTVAIVGRTGSGKSTLVDVITRMVDVPANTVFIDDRDITTMKLADLRRLVGYAPQEAFLFSRSIGENIAYGSRDGSDLSADELEYAATAAGLNNDLAILPDGLDTIVGERGVTLSGGQRQRVALARALASKPRILILDDSLSSVDAHTEREILGHLAQELSDRTAILISHRVAAVRRADQILVIDEGRIIERGSHAALLKQGGVYSELYQSQLADEILAGEDSQP